MADTQINVGMNVDGVITGTEKAKRSLKDLGGAASDAGKSTAKIGDGSEAAANKIERDTRRISNEFKRLQVAAETAGKSLSESMVIKANAYGVPLASIQAQIDGAKAFEKAQLASNAALLNGSSSLQKVGMSAAATSAALRNVPAQFTDIVTSLQGGQKPMTVLLQQGGQLKDMFGGVGGAARALGGYVLGMVNPITLAAAAAATLGYAFIAGRAESEAYNKALILTGSSAGTTAVQLSNMAQAVSKATGGTVGAAADALAQLAGSSNIAATQFERVAATALAMEKTTGVAVGETVKQFSELGKDPLSASLKLNESTRFLTMSVYEQIKALTEQGRTIEAGTLAQTAYLDVMDQRNPKLIANLGYIEAAWGGVGKAAKGAWDWMLNVGRDVDPLIAVRKRLDELTDPNKNHGIYGDDPRVKAEIDALKQKLGFAQETDRMMKRVAESQATAAASVKSQIDFDKEHDKYLSKSVQMNREIAAAGEKYAAVAQNPANLAKYIESVKGIQEKFKESAAPKASSKAVVADTYALLIEGMDKANTAARREIVTGEALSKSEKFRLDELYKIVDAYNLKKITVDQLIKAEARLEEVTANMSASESAIAAAKALVASQKELAAERTKEVLAHAKELESLGEKAQKLEDEVTMYGLSKSAIEELTTARMLDQIEVLKSFDNSSEEISRIEQTIAARKRLAAAGTALDKRDDLAKASVAAAKKSADEWKKGWEETDKIARDAFVGWAEGGISMAESIGKSLKKALLSAIYEATIRPIALAIYSSVVGGGSGAGGSAMGVVNGISAANTAYGMYSTGLSGTVGSSVGAAFGATAGNTALGMTQGLGYASSSLAANTASTAGANYAAVQAGGSAAGGSSAFSTVTPYAYIAAAIIGQAIFSKVMGLFTGPQAAETMGAAQGTFDAKGKMTASQAIDVGQSDSMIKTATERANILAQSYYSMAENLGIKAIESTFGFNSNTGEEGQHHNVDFRVNAGSAAYKSGEIDKNDTAAVTLAASRTVMTALQASELPKYLSGVFDGLTASTATQEQIDGVTKLAESYKGFHDQLQALPFEYLRDMSFAASKGLIAAAGTMENLGTLLGGYYEAFYTSEEKKVQLVKNTAASFEKLGIVMPALDDSARAWYRSEVDRLGAMDMSVAANASAYTSVLSLSGAMNTLVPAAKEASKALEDTAKTLLDAATKSASDAYSALERAVSSQSGALAITRDLASEQVAAIGSVFDTLKTNIDALYGQVGSTASMQAEQGNAFITQALSAAQSTGYLPDSTALTDAISAARSGVDSTIYASQQDADFARLVLAGKLSELKDIGGEQLTGAQKALVLAQGQVDALDGILTNAKLQLDAASGIDVSVRSVAASVSKLADSITALTAERASQGLETTKSAASVAASLDTSGVTVGHGSISSAVAAPSTYSFASVDSGMSTLYSSPSSPALLQALRDTAIATGVSIGDIATKYGYSNYGLEQMFASAGIPAFAYGGYHAGGLAVVGEQGPELVNFSQPSQIYTASQTQSMMGGNTARLEALVEGLTAEVQRLQSIVQTGNGHVERSADTLDKVTEGGNAMRSEIMNKVTVA